MRVKQGKVMVPSRARDTGQRGQFCRDCHWSVEQRAVDAKGEMVKKVRVATDTFDKANAFPGRPCGCHICWVRLVLIIPT